MLSLPLMYDLKAGMRGLSYEGGNLQLLVSVMDSYLQSYNSSMHIGMVHV